MTWTSALYLLQYTHLDCNFQLLLQPPWLIRCIYRISNSIRNTGKSSETVLVWHQQCWWASPCIASPNLLSHLTSCLPNHTTCRICETYILRCAAWDTQVGATVDTHTCTIFNSYYTPLPLQLPKIYHVYKLKGGSRRLDQELSHLVSQGLLNPDITLPNLEGVKDNNEDVSKLALLQN